MIRSVRANRSPIACTPPSRGGARIPVGKVIDGCSSPLSTQGSCLLPQALPPQDTQGSREGNSIRSSHYRASLWKETPHSQGARISNPLPPPQPPTHAILQSLYQKSTSACASSYTGSTLRMASQAGLFPCSCSLAQYEEEMGVPYHVPLPHHLTRTTISLNTAQAAREAKLRKCARVH